MGIKGALIELLSRTRGTRFLAALPTGLLDVVELDVTTAQNVVWPGQVTENPLENDEAYAHSIYRGPVMATIDGILTDSPIEFLAGIRPNATAKSKLQQLVDMRDREELVSVAMAMGSLLDMGIEEVSASRDPSLGDGIAVSVTLRRVKIVSSALVPAQFDLDALLAGAGGLVDMGMQAPIDPRSYTGPTSVVGG